MRKKLRPSELPLSQAKRSAIDSLVHMFRKKGAYDDIRRDLMKQYVSGVSGKIIIIVTPQADNHALAC